jgi:hypothetical protein
LNGDERCGARATERIEDECTAVVRGELSGDELGAETLRERDPTMDRRALVRPENAELFEVDGFLVGSRFLC